jgi:hypothetical protein
VLGSELTAKIKKNTADELHTWKMAVKILNSQPWTAEKRWFSSLRFAQGDDDLSR